jgi:rhodanese-related sulfurtransferase
MTNLLPHNEITPEELKKLLDNSTELTLVDVREQFEVDLCSIKGHVHIPLGSLTERFKEIPGNQPIVVYCKSGGRSASATSFLLSNGYKDVKNLVGGILSWADKIDPEIQKY